MTPDPQTLAQFKELYFKEFGEHISDEEATERFSRLASVLRVICYPEKTSHVDNPEGYDTVRTEN